MGYKSPRSLTVVFAHNVVDMADSTNYYFGMLPSSAPSTSSNNRNVISPVNGVIRTVALWIRSGTVGSNEGVTYNIRVNDATNYALSTTADLSASNVTVVKDGLNIPITAGQPMQINILTPAWGTNPLQVICNGCAVIDYE